mmetsp:Transcript_24323/g.70118  ORF Transcript_24323/g.70118 Transcript_24323/m.70118 type:complete len:162 (-) Transcript_24323:55-540(-)
MQSLSEEGSPSSLENQRRPHIPPIKRKERKNDKGKDKLSRGKMSDLFGKAKDAGVDGDKVTASSAAKGAMEVEAVGDNNDGMQSPLPAPPAPSNLLSSSNDNGGLGGVTAGSPSGGNHQGAAAVAGASEDDNPPNGMQLDVVPDRHTHKRRHVCVCDVNLQ